MSFGMLGLFFPITIYLQSALHMNPLDAGLTMMPMSLGSMLIAPFAGRLADRVGGKYILMSGLLIYSVAMGIIVAIAGPDSPGTIFLLPFTLGGVGLGLIFAPLATIAMREVTVVMAGAASGFMNTTRQLGSVLGSAVAGAVLEGQLAAAIREQATAAASQVPEGIRSQFVAGFTGLSSGGTDLARVRDVAAFLPTGLPAETLAQVQALAQHVFATAFVDAMRPTLTVSVALLAVSAASCAFIRRRRAEPVPLHSGPRPS
jgi:MFS family permease